MPERPRQPPASGAPERNSPDAPHQTARTREEKAARQARLAGELRRNLLKRKRQQRARDDRTPAED
jgi:hypothetical protein